jgi:hypothetical protein
MADDRERKPQPGDKDYQGGVFTTRVYSSGKNVEVTTKKDPNGNVEAVFVRDLFLGIF